jgi:hypothetical protein
MATEYRRGDRHVYRQIAGEHLLISLHRDTLAPMFALTPTAAALWERLASWQDREALVAHLLEEFDVTREQAGADVGDFLDQLAAISALHSREVAA